MRIVSQNRCISIEFANSIIYVETDSVFMRGLDGRTIDSRLLGRYSSHERAREVFDDIHNAYSPARGFYDVNTNKDAPEQGKWWDESPGFVLCANNNNNTTFQTIDNFVYYMPEE